LAFLGQKFSRPGWREALPSNWCMHEVQVLKSHRKGGFYL
jgi:hypothetical protein